MSNIKSKHFLSFIMYKLHYNCQRLRFCDTCYYSFLKYCLYFATVIDFMTCFDFTFCFYSFSYIFQLQTKIQVSFPMHLIFDALKTLGCIGTWPQSIICPRFSLYSSLRSIWTWLFQYASSTNMVRLCGSHVLLLLRSRSSCLCVEDFEIKLCVWS